MTLLHVIVLAASGLRASVSTTTEIAPGVYMPYINLGGVHSHPSNYTAWLELGGVGLDTALMYGDDVQVTVGDAVKASGIAREKLFITTKVPCCPASFTKWCAWYTSEYNDLGAGKRADIDARLLGVDVVDLMLLHWPCDSMADTIKAYRELEDYALAGKARAIGISNFNSSAIEQLYAAGPLRVKPSVNQCGFSIAGHNRSVYGRDFATLQKCEEKSITYSAYSPLGGLTGVDILSDPRVVNIGKAHNKSSAQVALRWVTQQGVVAVTASTNPAHLQTDLDIFDFSMTDAEMLVLTNI